MRLSVRSRHSLRRSPSTCTRTQQTVSADHSRRERRPATDTCVTPCCQNVSCRVSRMHVQWRVRSSVHSGVLFTVIFLNTL